MIEKALFIRDLKKFDRIGDGYSRLYFGNEFCERLLPSQALLEEAVSFVKERKMSLTFITPFVTDKGMKKLKETIEFLTGRIKETEIVVNDWGVLAMLEKTAWTGAISMGRLMTKQKRGPRIMNILKHLPDKAAEHFRQCSADSVIFKEFLVSRGIRRLELDNLLQGISRPADCLPASLYYPYAYVSTTRFCLISQYYNRAAARSIPDCKQECSESMFELKTKGMPVPLLLKGNTQFFRNEFLPENLKELNIDRLVFQPEVPL